MVKTALAMFIVVIALASTGLLAVEGTASLDVELGGGQSIATAAERKDWSTVDRLLKIDHDRKPQPDGMTALHWAVFWNHVESSQKLIDADYDVNARTNYEVTPLSIACQQGSPEMVKRLLGAGADCNAKLPGNESPLMTAARTGVREIIEHLVAAGAVVNGKDHRGQTALMWAAAQGNVEAVDALLDAGADPNIRLRSGFTAMMFAARQGKIDVARRLLEAGVDVNEVMRPANTSGRNPRDKMSAIMLAVESGHFQLALELVKAGADPNDQRSGFAPLHALSWVRKAKRGDSVEGDPPPRGSGNVTSLEFVGRLIEMGADVNLALQRGQGGRAKLNPKGATPFLMAARTADLPFMKRLWELGADPHRSNTEGCTPLLAAAGVGVTAVGEEPGSEREVIESINWLVQLGEDVNAVDDNLETVMHGAAYRQYPSVIAVLAGLGADPEVWDHRNKSGWTPVMIGEGHRPGSVKPSPETIEALRSARAVGRR